MENLKKFRGCYRYNFDNGKAILKVINNDRIIGLYTKISVSDVDLIDRKVLYIGSSGTTGTCKIGENKIVCNETSNAYSVSMTSPDILTIEKCSKINESEELTTHFNRVDDSECDGL